MVAETVIQKEQIKIALREIILEDETIFNKIIKELEFQRAREAFFAPKKKTKKKSNDTIDMEEIRKKHAIKWEDILILQELWEDTPPGEELIKMLTK